MKVTAIELAFGYVESTALATVVFDSQGEAFDSRAKALQSLVRDLKALYLDKFDTKPKLRKCCKKQKTKFCPDCGTKIAKEDFDEEAFSQWLRQIPTYDLDSWGYNEYLEDGTVLTWEPAAQGYAHLSHMEQEGYDVVCLDHAEEKLLAYLGDELPEDEDE